MFFNEITLLMFLSVELQCAVSVGYVRQQDRSYVWFAAQELIFEFHLQGSMNSEQETDEDQEGVCSPWNYNCDSSLHSCDSAGIVSSSPPTYTLCASHPGPEVI